MGWFTTALGLLFITLKLTEQINWSWWWVLLPLYGPELLGLVLIAIAAILTWHSERTW